MPKVTITLNHNHYTNLIQILETRIRSERARAAAFKRIEDTKNAYFAKLKHGGLIELKEAVASGVQHTDGENA